MDFLTENNLTGLVIGICTFLIIGLFHPLVVKAEYYLTKKSWILFLIVGIIGAAASYFVHHIFFSTMLGVFSFSCFWSIHEVIEQEERVKKGWAKKNPKHKYNKNADNIQ
jgi:hypothetical protein